MWNKYIYTNGHYCCCTLVWYTSQKYTGYCCFFFFHLLMWSTSKIYRHGLNNTTGSSFKLFSITQGSPYLYPNMLPSHSVACSACRISCSKCGVLGWKGIKYNYMATHCNGAAQRRLASAGFRGSYRRSGFMFVSKYLYAEEDEGDNMLPKAQPGRTFFKSLVCYSLNGFKTNLPDGKHSSISEYMSQNKCKRATAIKTPYVSFVQNKSRPLAANVLLSFIKVDDRSWVNRIHLTETIKREILRQEHPIRLWRLMHSQR